MTKARAFGEVSYGRLAFSVTPVARWIRMPAPTTAYLSSYNREAVHRYVEDAVAAADPFVDFSRFNNVTLWNAVGWNTGYGAFQLPPAVGLPPIVADGTQISFAVWLAGEAANRGPVVRNFWTHENLHVLGLPDLGGRWAGIRCRRRSSPRPSRTCSAGTSGCSAGSTRRS